MEDPQVKVLIHTRCENVRKTLTLRSSIIQNSSQHENLEHTWLVLGSQ